MVKRKANVDDKVPAKDKMEVDGEDSGSDDDTSILDVDFEWFDPQPAVDFHGLKTLLRQLFDTDNQLFDLSELTDLILSQPTLGSTVKCDGNESDPYAFLTVLNLHQHREKAVIQQLTAYLLRVSQVQEKLHAQLQSLLSAESGDKAQVGLILTERVINMPHQTVPPMYNMLREEIQWALDDAEPYNFTHYLVISKAYTEVASKLDAEDHPPSKKNKKAAAYEETFYFHPEDEVLQKFSDGLYSNFEYEKQGDEGASDSKRTFSELGVKPKGHLILVEGAKFESAVKAIEQYLSGE